MSTTACRNRSSPPPHMPAAASAPAPTPAHRGPRDASPDRTCARTPSFEVVDDRVQLRDVRFVVQQWAATAVGQQPAQLGDPFGVELALRFQPLGQRQQAAFDGRHPAGGHWVAKFRSGWLANQSADRSRQPGPVQTAGEAASPPLGDAGAPSRLGPRRVSPVRLKMVTELRWDRTVHGASRWNACLEFVLLVARRRRSAPARAMAIPNRLTSKRGHTRSAAWDRWLGLPLDGSGRTRECGTVREPARSALLGPA
jgi:hypothetical protein